MPYFIKNELYETFSSENRAILKKLLILLTLNSFILLFFLSSQFTGFSIGLNISYIIP